MIYGYGDMVYVKRAQVRVRVHVKRARVHGYIVQGTRYMVEKNTPKNANVQMYIYIYVRIKLVLENWVKNHAVGDKMN